jgi:membrane-associated phospholipid phosphatase
VKGPSRVAPWLAVAFALLLVCAARRAAAQANAAPASPAPVSPAPAPTPSVLPSALLPTPQPPPYHFQSGLTCPFCQITPQFPTGRSGLHWHNHWRSAGTREYLTIAGLAGALAGVYLLLPQPDKPRWNEPILFDRSVRDALRIHSAHGRRVAAAWSDALFVWEVAHPSLIDPLLVAWWQRESPYVAWQMFVIDAQAYSLTLLLTELTKRLTARARPWASSGDCAENPDSPACGSGGRYVSFNSGHAATTATGAGLICAHHTQLSLYQSNLLDVGTCLLAVAGTAVTGAMRIASDNHWLSDVLIGHLIGYVSGYVLPTALYYRQFRSQPEAPHEPAPVMAALPLLTPHGLGLTLLGQF